MRVGLGFDVHALVFGRRLVLGGVEVPYEKGLLGHSDADVLIHAICDALLGAAGMGDIGEHFPDTDETYRDLDSRVLLTSCVDKLHQAGYVIVNVDAVVIAQAPKLSPYKQRMREALSQVMRLAPERINLKASTTEHQGFCGRGEGICAQAVCLIEERE